MVVFPKVVCFRERVYVTTCFGSKDIEERMFEEIASVNNAV